jgi:hypothetical protein|tara:strand:+ start:442 stop:726 length:285 start_codon:yes stop_codon:yes gene_type:complete
MYSLATTERFNTLQHGKTNDSTPFIDNHYLIHEIIDCDAFMQQQYDSNEVDIVEIVELPGLEHVAIFKTVWLKLMQRKFRREFRAQNSFDALIP